MSLFTHTHTHKSAHYMTSRFFFWGEAALNFVKKTGERLSSSITSSTKTPPFPPVT